MNEAPKDALRAVREGDWLAVGNVMEERARQRERLLAGVPDAAPRISHQPPKGWIVQQLAQRGFWSLSPAAQMSLFEFEDLGGSMVVEPSSYGVSGIREAYVFTMLFSLHSRRPNNGVVEESLHNLAVELGYAWGGKTANDLRESIEMLKRTLYRIEVQTESGGYSDLFSLLDRVQTRWTGPEQSKHRRFRAVFSEAVLEMIGGEKKMIRPVDLAVLRDLPAQATVARRLFLFLEGSPMHRDTPNVEHVERIIDARLLNTLGMRSALKHAPRYLTRAGRQIIAVTPRYETIEVVPRTAQGLRRGEPRFLLRVVRRRIAPQRP